MATTVEAGFNDFLSNQQITATQRLTANTRIEGIRTFFNNNFTMAEPVFTAGSFARGTICRSQRDIDLMAVLSYPAYKARYDNDPQAMLYFIRNQLNDRYATTNVSSKRVAVTLDFQSFAVDLVPCYPRSDIGKGYLMHDGKKGWMSTNPKYHAQFFSNADTALADRLKPLIRIMKAWNIYNGSHLRSFHLEIIMEKMWRGKAIGTWPYAVQQTLKVLGSYVENPRYDPWSSSKRVDDYLSATMRALIVRIIEGDAKRALDAESYRTSANIAKAFDRWDNVFNKHFPAYG